MAIQQYNFDQVVSRKDSDSVKWRRYPADVLPLWVADMDFPAPPQVLDAIRARLDHPFFGYASENEALLPAICSWIKKRHNWIVDPQWLLLMPGVVTGMNWAVRACLKPQESLCFFTPVYPPFFSLAANADVSQKTVPFLFDGGSYQIDFVALREALLSEVGMFVLCNPHNPVGNVFSAQELARLSELCLEYGSIVCSDEIHCDLIFPPYRHVPAASVSEAAAQNTITLMAPSKTFNIPGLHFSFAVVPNPDLRKKMEKARGGLVGHPTMLSSEAALAAFNSGADWLDQLLVYLQGNRDFLLGYIRDFMPEIHMSLPQGTYLAWLDCRGLNLKPSPYQFFLEKAHVALNDGAAFGAGFEGFVRLNFGCPRPLLEDALERMQKALKER